MPLNRRRIVLIGCLLLASCLVAPSVQRLTPRAAAQDIHIFLPFVTQVGEAQPPPPVPVEGHPRLWLAADDLPRLRSWATDANPFYREGLARVADRAKADMDAGSVINGDCGTNEYEDYPVEMYAEFFAFMSLVEPNAAARADYAQRAHTLLMHIMNEAVKGPAAEAEQDYLCPYLEEPFPAYPPYRDPEFYSHDSNRARWHGEAYPLVVDWIHPALSAADKTTIRQVFLRWADEIVNTGYHHPMPEGTINDPALLQDRAQVRWSGNNYYTAHMRNLGLMALALDPADDPGGDLRAYLANAIGAWLYIFDELTRTDSRGGMLPEGFEYSPQTSAYAIQFLLALYTAGEDDPIQWQGNHVVLTANPFWDDLATAYLHSLSPATITLDEMTVYQPAWYGDAQVYRMGDFIDAFAPLGVYHAARSDTTRAQTLRWIERHTPPGGEDLLLERAGNPDDLRHAIFYFLLMDPDAPAPADPRPVLPTHFYAGGLNRLLARTDWSEDAAWFVYTLSWNQIDHQQADGNHFEFYRNGEWLTKARSGYADIAEGIASSEFRNTLTLENDKPDRDESDWRIDLWRRGSQWNLGPDGDPELLAYSASEDYVYALGEATNLYNWTDENADDIVHASRSIVWLKPDHIILYDRGASATAGRFKRVWLQLPTPAQVQGQQATMTTAAGQHLFVTVLLPQNAVLTAVNTADEHVENTAAGGEPMKVRLRTEAPGGPLQVQFLHVLQGADAGAAPDAVTLIQSSAGAAPDAVTLIQSSAGAAPDAVTLIQSSAGASFAGVALLDTALLFPVDLSASFTSVTYRAPAAATRHLVTGLAPNGGYAVAMTAIGGEMEISIQPGTQVHADQAGVLTITTTAAE
jgi:hypothetical protein